MPPCLFAENFFSPAQFPEHVVTADEEPAGHEAARAANGRRSALDYATATTDNDPWWLQVACDRLRGANCVALDRGTNLFGFPIQLQRSYDASTWTDVLNLTLPTVSGPGSLDDTLGVRTEEGAWLKRFDLVGAPYWRLYVPAMGAGVRPQIVGIWLGLAYAPPYLYRPNAPDEDELVIEERPTVRGTSGRSPGVNRRGGAITLRMQTAFEYELARYHLQQVFGRGAPTWLIHDDHQAERAVLAVRPGNGRLGLGVESGNWAFPRGQVEWVEWEAAA